VPIVLVADVPNILVVNNELPAKDLAEFGRHALANPGKLNFGSTGIGSSMHLAAELYMRETGTQMQHVPYNAPGTATTNMIAGDIQLMFQLVPGIAGQVKGGKVRALALMAPQRSPALPDVPTTAELGQPKLLSSTWFALLAPKGTPNAVVERLNSAANDALADPAVRQRLSAMGATPLGSTPQQAAAHLAAETTKWGQLVRDAKVQMP
jgi:tripartite-type tricarboxylate transporter receptor subunit TctC